MPGAGTSKSTQDTQQSQSGNSQSNPWANSMPALNSLLGGINGQFGNAGLTGNETGALNTLRSNASGAPNYGGAATDLAGRLINGGPDLTGMAGGAYGTYGNTANGALDQYGRATGQAVDQFGSASGGALDQYSRDTGGQLGSYTGQAMGALGNFAGATNRAVGGFTGASRGALNDYTTGQNNGLNSYSGGLSPYLSQDYLDPSKSPGMAGILDTIKNDVSNSVNGMFAGAGRDLSGMNQQSLARGMSQGMAAPLLDQYNRNVSTQRGAQDANFQAGNATGGNIYNARTGTAGNIFGAQSGAAGDIYNAASSTAGNLYGAGSAAAGNLYGARAGNAASQFGAQSGAAGDIYNARSGTAGNLYNAGNTTTGLLSNLNQTSLGNRMQGLDLGMNTVPGAMNGNANAMLQAEAQARGIPLQNLGMLAGLTLPIAGLGGSNSYSGTGTSSMQGSQTMSPMQQALMASGIFGNLAGGYKNLGFGGAK